MDVRTASGLLHEKMLEPFASTEDERRGVRGQRVDAGGRAGPAAGGQHPRGGGRRPSQKPAARHGRLPPTSRRDPPMLAAALQAEVLAGGGGGASAARSVLAVEAGRRRGGVRSLAGTLAYATTAASRISPEAQNQEEYRRTRTTGKRSIAN
ncbi:hypothetical protein DIPPA_06852 [Diplonema papillatum]|nr:hypothetical protein DIPPA_06852 [Diplonema papillatum]